MKKRNRFMKVVTISALAVGSLLVQQCHSNAVTPNEPSKFELGPSIDLGSSQVASPGVASVQKNGHPLNGLTITVPDSAYQGTRQFTISSSEIISHDFGSLVHPISPLIKVVSSGGYANNIYELNIPISLPSGSFPLVFIYNDHNAKLEPLPIKSFTASNVVALTRHFATSIIDQQRSTGGIQIQAAEEYSKIFVSSMQESTVLNTPVISSGFKPGVDDWEFPNYGSYLETGGHCAGQNMAAMWYYFEQKSKTGEKLFNRFSDNPNLWEDDARGYRFCSVIQKDFDWESAAIRFFDKYIDRNQSLDRMKFLTVAGAMLVTGEPQGIGIYRETGIGNDGLPVYGGHDLICYQIGVVEGKLYISDPNTPGLEQAIQFNGNKFEPYMAKTNAGDANHEYPYVTYYAKTAYIEWNAIATRYQQLLDGTIGTIEPSTFPKYTIRVKDVNDHVLVDNDAYASSAVQLYVECNATIGWQVNNTLRVTFDVFNEAGQSVAQYVSDGVYRVTLTPGKTKLGICVQPTIDLSTKSTRFVDFKWYTFSYRNAPIKIIPQTRTVDVGSENTWNLNMDSVPKNLQYYVKWNFGDNSAEQVMSNVNYAAHTYTSTGPHTIKASLWDASDNTCLSTDSATVQVGGSSYIKPTWGSEGTIIIINGSGFGNTQRSGDNVTLHFPDDVDNHDYRAIHALSWSDKRIVASVRSEQGTVGKCKIKVRLYNSSDMTYTWLGPWDFELVRLQVGTVKPDTITVDSTLTINGSNFGEQSIGDSVYFNDRPTPQLISWTNTQILCAVPDMPASDYVQIAVVKGVEDPADRFSGIANVATANQTLWLPRKSDIVSLLQRAYDCNAGSIAYTVNATMINYNTKGDSTSAVDYQDVMSSSLYNETSPDYLFSSNGTDFQITFSYSGSDGRVSCSGKVSSDGRHLETATYTRYDAADRVVLRIGLKNLPLTAYFTSQPQFGWTYEVPSNASSYVSDYYKASYYSNGALNSISKMRSAVKVNLSLFGRIH